MHKTTESRLLCPSLFFEKAGGGGGSGVNNEIQCIGMINAEERRFSVPRCFLETV